MTFDTISKAFDNVFVEQVPLDEETDSAGYDPNHLVKHFNTRCVIESFYLLIICASVVR